MAAKKNVSKKSSVKKNVVKKTAKKVVVSTLSVCPACHSHHLKTLGDSFKCLRCGRVSKVVVQKDHVAAKELLRNRKRHTINAHKAYKEHHHRSLKEFVNNFHLRMWFKIVSTFLLGFGLVLLPTSESLLGVLFSVIGVVGLYAGLKWF